MIRAKYYIITLLCLITVNCSTIYGSSTNSEGNQSISESPTVITFESEVGSTLYKSVTFTNSSEENYEINNLAFVDNDCGAFSIYNITDESENTLYSAGDAISVSVTTGSSVSINIRFSPTSCEITEYTTTFVVYYDTDTTSEAISISLEATVTDNTPDALNCEDSNISYYDEFDNPTERTLPVLSDGEIYYLKVKKMSAYMQTTGGFTSFATQVGTHINLDTIDEADQFQPVYLSLTTNDAGDLTVAPVDACVGFDLPSPPTDPFFLGAAVSVTTATEFTGTINRDDDPGLIELPDIVFNLSSFINDSNSLLQDSDGFFEINIKTLLTSGETEENEYLDNLADLEDDDGEPFFNISNSKLVGKNIRHGTVTLVGVAQFQNDDDAKMSNEGIQAILENEAYLFLQIEGLITQIEE